ncbi:transcription regulator ArsR [Yersinia kristensenii]|nr:transcription regulator ArsR [Yersinia kristensenii]
MGLFLVDHYVRIYNIKIYNEWKVFEMHMNNNKTISMDLMRYAAGQACDVLRILANEDRLLLLCQLSQGEKAVGELEQALGIHQPTLSQQLGVLRSDGLVNTRREGKRIFYSIADNKILALLEVLYQLYCSQEKEGA